MTEQKRLLIRAISFLLRYPDAELSGSLDSIEKMLEDLPAVQARGELREAVSKLRAAPALQLQEEYTRLFDFSPPTSLNLTYHKWGDGKERGHALARMHQNYKRAGYSLSGGELPDYLPLVLEFLSVCPGETFSLIVREYRTEIESLVSRLKDAGSPYAHCLTAFLDVLDERAPGGDEQPIRSGVPVEGRSE